jgi:hypothetical protein
VFGDNARLEEKLRDNGARANAEVLSAKESGYAVSHGGAAGQGVLAAAAGDPSSRRAWKLRLRVKPEGEPEFEVAIKDTFDPLNAPTVGADVRVLYDPKHHSKVVLDHSGGAGLRDQLLDGAEKLRQAHPEWMRDKGPDDPGSPTSGFRRRLSGG